MTMPLIGISGSTNDHTQQVFLMRGYMQKVLKSGAIPVLLCPDMESCAMEELLNHLDGLLLAGGGDIAPAHFGEEPIAQLGEVSPIRDAFELSILAKAIKRKMPVLGICRGVQVMNVALGGSLYQDLPVQYSSQHASVINHQQEKNYEIPTHAVHIKRTSLLFRLLGQDTLLVNSMHHQAVKAAAPTLSVVAKATDGVVEALELPELPFFIGVQWHPERLPDEASERLFAGFVQIAEKYRRQTP